jgi:hypothetical protein
MELPESLTAEQRALLAQFELRALAVSEDTAVVGVGHSSMWYAEEASTTSSSRASSTHSQTSTQGSASPTTGSHARIPTPHSGATHDTATGTINTTCLAAMGSDLVHARQLASEDTYLEQDPHATAYPSPPAGVKETADSSESANIDGGGWVGVYYVGGAVPLFHLREGVADAVRQDASSFDKSEGESYFRLKAAMTNNDAEYGASTDERCQRLAERLVQQSAEVDAVEFAMDRAVPPPSEFF